MSSLISFLLILAHFCPFLANQKTAVRINGWTDGHTLSVFREEKRYENGQDHAKEEEEEEEEEKNKQEKQEKQK